MLRGLLGGIVLLSMQACAGPQRIDMTQPSLVEISVYTQSLGRGVPDSATRAFGKVLERLRREGISPTPTPWGLEGERRICVVGEESYQFAEVENDIVALIEGVALITIERRTVSSEAGRRCRTWFGTRGQGQ